MFRMILERILDIWYYHPVMVYFIIGPEPLPVEDFMPNYHHLHHHDHHHHLMPVAGPDYLPPLHYGELEDDWLDYDTPISDSEISDFGISDAENSETFYSWEDDDEEYL
ncbi:uncharacterized protein LOC120456057 isoform X1 [Drosophila santomea]|uniref:uncharacterized protein LOC120456057 isoform X1 n=1 Tax=Drosophila santomea TaxID=129105 RepID=UPI001953A43D|nr:uncharacterized protein LOC120456057 isoform X1 [Drosophila santomea]